jgi:hypothetical protein
MTQRGLVFGNSHAASLRLAWRLQQADWSDLVLDFAAASGEGMDTFVLQNGVLSTPDVKARDNITALNGRHEFDLRSYDFFLICGGTPSMFHAVHLYRAAGIPAFARSVDGDRQLMSRACFQAALAGVMQGGMGYRLAVKLAAMGKPCFVTGHPRLSVAARADPKSFAGFLRVEQNKDAAQLSALFDAAAIDAFAGLATYLPQPPATITDDIFTDEAYRRGAIRLTPTDDVAQPPQDYLHANAVYGALIIDGLCGQLAGTMAQGPDADKQ